MARTFLDESPGCRPDFIKHQLAQAKSDLNGRAYNRTAHLPKRRKMMQAWADYLDARRDTLSNAVPIKRNARQSKAMSKRKTPHELPGDLSNPSDKTHVRSAALAAIKEALKPGHTN